MIVSADISDELVNQIDRIVGQNVIQRALKRQFNSKQELELYMKKYPYYNRSSIIKAALEKFLAEPNALVALALAEIEKAAARARSPKVTPTAPQQIEGK